METKAKIIAFMVIFPWSLVFLGLWYLLKGIKKTDYDKWIDHNNCDEDK